MYATSASAALPVLVTATPVSFPRLPSGTVPRRRRFTVARTDRGPTDHGAAGTGPAQRGAVAGPHPLLLDARPVGWCHPRGPLRAGGRPWPVTPQELLLRDGGHGRACRRIRRWRGV